MYRVLARLICLLLFAAITISWPLIASGTELYIPALKGQSGQSVDIPIMIDQVDNLAGVKLIMRYDPEILTFKKGMRTKHTSSLMHIINDKKPGILIVVMAGAKGIKGKDFSIIKLTFVIKKELKGNHTTQIKITEVQLMSDKLKDIKCNVKVGPLIISPEPEQAITK